MLCMVAATVFWFFNALNKSYSTNISFPIVFEYDEEHYTPTEALPVTVRMNVSGTGWELFRRSSGFKVPALTIPLEKPAEVRKILGAQLPAILSSQLERLQINFVITDTLRLNLEEKVRRKFSVNLDSVQDYIHPDFGLTSEVTLQPDTIWLEGPKQFITSLPPVLQLALSQKDIRKDYKEAVALPYKNILQTPVTTHVSFSVAEFITVSDSITLTVLNKPARSKSAIAKRIACTYQLPATEVQTVRSVQATIDLQALPRSITKLAPQVTGLPPYARLIKTDSVIVNF